MEMLSGYREWQISLVDGTEAYLTGHWYLRLLELGLLNFDYFV